MNELQRHLQAQRDSAMRLMQAHNQMLAIALGRSDANTDHGGPVWSAHEALPSHSSIVEREVKAVTKGNVVSLFEYKNDRHSANNEMVTGGSEYFIFNETDPVALEEWGETIDSLLVQYGSDDALAIHRKILAGTIFFNSTKDAFFYHQCAKGVMLVLCYVGPEDRYDDSLSEIIAYTDENDTVINFMVQEDRVEALTAHGLSTTPVGIWQRIEPIDDFTIAGSKMRRLRYLVNKYKKMGDVKTIEYVPGTTREVDVEICAVIDEWVELKGENPPFVPTLKKQVMAGSVNSCHHFFLTYRDDKLENVIVLSVDYLNDGYLMDAEFYVKDLPLGSTEFAITEMIECFKKEGKKVLSLGLTLGTGLFEHENRSQEVHDLYASLKKTDFVNGDANAQYKNKYRPACVSVYLARPKGCGTKRLNDLLILMAQGYV